MANTLRRTPSYSNVPSFHYAPRRLSHAAQGVCTHIVRLIFTIFPFLFCCLVPQLVPSPCCARAQFVASLLCTNSVQFQHYLFIAIIIDVFFSNLILFFSLGLPPGRRCPRRLPMPRRRPAPCALLLTPLSAKMLVINGTELLSAECVCGNAGGRARDKTRKRGNTGNETNERKEK